MTPEYLRELADIADPDELWRTVSLLGQKDLKIDKRIQLDTGIALRRYAHDVERINSLIGTGKSYLVTPISKNGTDYKIVDSPKDVKKRVELTESNLKR